MILLRFCVSQRILSRNLGWICKQFANKSSIQLGTTDTNWNHDRFISIWKPL